MDYKPSVLPPKHPGEILREYLDYIDMTIPQFALAIRKNSIYLKAFCNKKNSLTADYALVFERSIGTKASEWMQMQSDYDLWHANNEIFRELSYIHAIDTVNI